ncbi:tetratricopeptide repeat protein [Streptomyces albogriseolus]|uniref:tetratricopeptide repeat protein n=1 Tax=Streptomyces albogriseolus TaxID=1887 RepID=UPI00224DE43C|nr:tetratricopeptide repeat protein [Streptomyces viridodiastaticus]MCX4624395.1 tetratricopeptide repeat protein [Streptomyces viridodiastaticus]
MSESADGGLPPHTRNEISGGVFFNTVIQGRNINVNLPPRIPSALSGLPAVSPAFTGRDGHLEELFRLLDPATGKQQPVLMTGLAGAGKTELALQCAIRVRDSLSWFPGGVLMLDLFGYDPVRRLDPELALRDMLRALGIPGEHIPDGLQDRARLYRSALATLAEQGQRILLVLDNAVDAHQVEPLLPTDGETAVLVTSRHVLDVGARLHEVDVLDHTASATLLRVSLQQARGPADTRVDDDPGAAAAVVELCAGLPLALQIAAALLADSPARPLASLARALEQSQTRLDELSRADRAVRAAFDLSYRDLDAPHARLFRLLPLSPGPDLSTESVAHLTDLGERTTERLLLDLARANLLGPGRVWGRWRLHDLVRLYAEDRGREHAQEDDHAAATARLRHHYETRMDAAETYLPTSYFARSSSFANREEAFAWMDDERANLVAAATQGIAFTELSTEVLQPPRKGSFAYPVAVVARHPFSALTHYLAFRRHYDDLILISTAAVTRSQDSGDRISEAIAFDALGLALHAGRKFAESVEAHTGALTIARDLGDRHSEARFQCHLGHSLAGSHKPGQALKLYKRSIKVFARFGDHLAEGGALTAAGLALFLMRRFEEAVDMHERSLTVLSRLDDHQFTTFDALNNLGLALREAKRLQEAVDVHRKAVALAAALGNRHGEGVALSNLGSALCQAKEYKSSIRAHRKAVAISVELEDRVMEGTALGNLGIVLGDAIKFKRAIRTLNRAAIIFGELSDPYEECKVLNNLGSTLVEKGDYAGAIATYERAAEVGAAVNEPHLTSQIGRNMQFAVAKEAIMNADSADDLDYSRTRATRDEPSLPDRVRSWLRRRPNR